MAFVYDEIDIFCAHTTLQNNDKGIQDIRESFVWTFIKFRIYTLILKLYMTNFVMYNCCLNGTMP
jgi:hypothetical protein